MRELYSTGDIAEGTYFEHRNHGLRRVITGGEATYQLWQMHQLNAYVDFDQVGREKKRGGPFQHMLDDLTSADVIL